MKGMSPVLSLILLLLIVVGSAGGYMVYVTGIQGQLTNQYEKNIVYPVNPPQAMNIICYPGYGFIDVINNTVGGLVGTINYFVKVGGTAVSGQRTVNFTDYGRIYFGLPSDVGGKVKFELYTPDWTISEFCTVREDLTLKLHLPFDETSGITTGDESKYDNDGTLSGYVADGTVSGANDGTIVGATWVEGYLGNALHFDDAEYVDVPDNIELYNRSFSVSAWLKPDLNPPSEQVFFSAHCLSSIGGSVHLRFYSTGSLRFGYYSDDLVTSTGIANFGKWQHVVFTYNRDTDISKIYFNGTEVGSGPQGPLICANPDIRIGRWFAGAPQTWEGVIDDLRIYHKTLNTTEVQTLYMGGDVSSNLIGHWKFDTGRGSTAYDSHLWVGGKYGNAINLNGVSDQIIIPHSSEFEDLGDFSINLWFKYHGAGPFPKGYYSLIAKNAVGLGYLDPFHLWITNGTAVSPQQLQARFGNGTYDGDLGCSGNVVDGIFHQVSFTYNNDTKVYSLYLDGSLCDDETRVDGFWIPAQNSDDLSFGVWDLYNNNFNGLIDDVRFYRRTLNLTEIENLYQGVTVDENLIGYWKLDEPSGTTAVDSHMWATGVSGTAMNFDGVNDLVEILDSSSLDIATELSITAWVKPTIIAGQQGIISKQYVSEVWSLYQRENGDIGFMLSTNGDNVWTSTPTNQLIAKEWRHIAVTYNKTHKVMYVEGLQVQSVLDTGFIDTNDLTLRIGYDSAVGSPKYFSGLIDDVRIYDKALSSAEIYALYDTYK